MTTSLIADRAPDSEARSDHPHIGFAFVLVLVLAIGSLSLGARFGPDTGIGAIAFFLGGLLSALAVNELIAAIGVPREESELPQMSVTFNMAVVRQGINRVEVESFQTGPPSLPRSSESQELTPRGFVGQDNALALTYLRLELERLLIRIAKASTVAPERGAWSAVTLARVLGTNGVLAPEVVRALLEILRVCNAAVHGASIADDTALAVVTTGEAMLAYLRDIAITNPDNHSK
jgi:hypothetical protein